MSRRHEPSEANSLDVVLGGGIEPGSVTVLAGAPGAGKTILSQQMCFANATLEHRVVYYTTLSEPHSKLVRHLEPFDFFTPEALGPRVEYLHLGDLIREDRPGRMEPLVDEVARSRWTSNRLVVLVGAVAWSSPGSWGATRATSWDPGRSVWLSVATCRSCGRCRHFGGYLSPFAGLGRVRHYTVFIDNDILTLMCCCSPTNGSASTPPGGPP